MQAGIDTPRTTMHHRHAHRRFHARRAFTLLEVIIAVTIVALLATILVPNVTRWLGVAKGRKAEADVNSLAQQVRLYMTEKGMSRLSEDFELDMLCQGEDPIISNPNSLNDPWGHRYVVIVPPSVNRDFDVMSYGADGQPGGEGDARDIVNGAR
jgi:general secretion pathway protein G